MKSIAIFLCCLIGGAVAAHAQEVQWAGFKLVRGIGDAKELAKPAELSYTAPEDGRASALVNAGLYGVLGIYVPGAVLSELSFGASYHRNTAVSKEQDVVLVGAGALGETWSWLQHKGALEAKNDRRKGSRGLVGSLQLMPYVPAALNSRARWGGVPATPSLSFGVQHERISSTDEETALALRAAGLTPTGNVTRLTAAAGLVLELGPALLEGSASYWNDRRRSGPFVAEDKSQSLRSVSLGFPLDEKKAAVIAISRVEGSDPVEGLAKTKYTQLTLKVRLAGLFK